MRILLHALMITTITTMCAVLGIVPRPMCLFTRCLFLHNFQLYMIGLLFPGVYTKFVAPHGKAGVLQRGSKTYLAAYIHHATSTSLLNLLDHVNQPRYSDITVVICFQHMRVPAATTLLSTTPIQQTGWSANGHTQASHAPCHTGRRENATRPALVTLKVLTWRIA